MIRFKMHSIYDHYPDRHPVGGEPYIECYSDSKVTECTQPGKNIAWMLEPRSMIGEYYNYVQQNAHLFRYIFTHDSILLKLPQARPFNWAEVWLTTDSEKNKGISICSSFKDWCPLHKARTWLAEYYDQHPGQVDTFGSYKGDRDAWIDAKEYLEHYRYSIIIENDIDYLWYTEKILNCFATKTVPIYVGSPTIGEKFNAAGIIQAQNCDQIPRIVEQLDIENDYISRIDAINDNFTRLDYYRTPWKERFIRDYGDILEGLQYE